MGEKYDTPLGLLTLENFRPVGTRHRLFVGPKFLFSLFNPGDKLHTVCKLFMRFLRNNELPYRKLLVNDHVVDEAATRLKKRTSNKYTEAFIETIGSSGIYEEKITGDTEYSKAKETFLERTKLDAAFTDHLVAAHMKELNIDHIVTFDTHYDSFNLTTLPH
ncbi:MAG: type II toxin-antitoxin system VapC family toxin [Halobacteria archaeon]